MGALIRKLARWRTSPRIATAMEMACLAPALALLVAGLLTWGGYFWLSRQIQAAADDALAAAVAEINVDAREGKAKAEAERALAASAALGSGTMQVSVVTQPRRLTVLLIYDASRSPMFALGRLMPMPSPMIVRSASRRLAS
ncbi:TadE/TadG family type IV pilus assembly protein [Phenylobacterium sp.]|uniref:TadE/TadG family type IV pilus assembly protein n=1 Tax=Phenylobacterium sp. TaxID=1871053 RepID=UPI0035ADEBC1